MYHTEYDREDESEYAERSISSLIKKSLEHRAHLCESLPEGWSVSCWWSRRSRSMLLDRWSDDEAKVILELSLFQDITYAVALSEMRIGKVLLTIISYHIATFGTRFLDIREEIRVDERGNLTEVCLLESELCSSIGQDITRDIGPIDSLDEWHLRYTEYARVHTCIADRTTCHIDEVYGWATIYLEMGRCDE